MEKVCKYCKHFILCAIDMGWCLNKEEYTRAWSNCGSYIGVSKVINN